MGPTPMRQPLHLRALLLGALLTQLAHSQAGDDCSSPIVIGGAGTFAWDNSLNTTSGFDGGDPSTCFSPGNTSTTASAIRSDVFFVWTVPAGGGAYQIDTEGSVGNDDTKLAVHAGSDCGATCVASDDDGGSSPEYSSLIQLTGLQAGDQYLIQVGSWNDTSPVGDGLLNITSLSAPANDSCATPQVVAGLGTFPWDNANATTSGFDGGDPTSCFSPTNAGTTGSDTIRKDLFFVWTVPAGGGTYQIDTEGSVGNDDTKLSVHAGSDCGATCVASDDDSGGAPEYSSKIVLSNLTGGDQYLIQVGSWNDTSSAGTGLLNISVPPLPPGNDTCATAQTVTGLGSWGFDTTTATVSGFAGGGGCVSGALSMGADVFLQWTAPSAGDFLVDTCGTPFDTLLTAHAGAGCAAACLAHNDDGLCGSFNSELILSGLAAGEQVLLQVGGYGGAAGPGTLTISSWSDPCGGLGPDPYEDNDACGAEAPLADGLHAGLTVRRDDLDLYRVVVPAGATLDVVCDHDPAVADLDIFLFDAALCLDDPSVDPTCSQSLACGWTSQAPETLTWTNTTGSDQTCTLRVSVWPGAQGECASYDLSVSGAASTGPALFCDPASPNSTGAPVSLASSSLSGPGVLHIEADGGPLDQFGMVLVSASFADPGVAVSDGQLCLGAPIGRYGAGAGAGLNSIGRFDAAGVLVNLFGTSATGTGFDVPATLPSPPGGVITTGETWFFQLWYRDGAASNFSNGLSVTF